MNSLYDPLEFLAPVTVHSRLLRELIMQAEDWDSLLPKDKEVKWTRWKQSLRDLEGLQIPRAYTSFSTASALRRELFVFADASIKAISAVAYIKVTSHQGQTETGFVFEKGSLAPQPGLTMPRLELCAAVQVAIPFTYVGVDVFGPWDIVSRRTRGGVSNSKRWAVIFSCICSRAVHIEVIEAMSSSNFINAFRRFFAIKGPAKQIHSDCKTNFTATSLELEMVRTNPGFNNVEDYLDTQSCTWVFNPPHAPPYETRGVGACGANDQHHLSYSELHAARTSPSPT